MTIENKPFIFGVATSGDTWKIAQNKGCNIVVCIDEFQQIAEYPEKGVEALLRSYIQFVPNARFIFAGRKSTTTLPVISSKR